MFSSNICRCNVANESKAAAQHSVPQLENKEKYINREE